MPQLDERKQRILSAIVEMFAATGEPVGSKALAQVFDNAFSSATIRNEMAALTDMGADSTAAHLLRPGAFPPGIPAVCGPANAAPPFEP